jgi:hypothetical protein
LIVHLQFTTMGLVALAPPALPPDFHFGDASQVSVGVLLDGQPSSGFTVMLVTPRIFMPRINK